MWPSQHKVLAVHQLGKLQVHEFQYDCTNNADHAVKRLDISTVSALVLMPSQSVNHPIVYSAPESFTESLSRSQNCSSLFVMLTE